MKCLDGMAAVLGHAEPAEFGQHWVCGPCSQLGSYSIHQCMGSAGRTGCGVRCLHPHERRKHIWHGWNCNLRDLYPTGRYASDYDGLFRRCELQNVDIPSASRCRRPRGIRGGFGFFGEPIQLWAVCDLYGHGHWPGYYPDRRCHFL